ncbi:hypothetical protein GFL38_10385 [Rhizobium leguminosarum bv. viciae]|uniref:hypothetical protein n=1 Tax=Rhizobium ruizarguesonis TaxID=2081791 RepID=UPI00143F6CAC|nr:hypothetical protein [Rhizobium ruizarguesonis]NKJ72671.1 hypothetical protein [Rhizobium leguminosarum bv. viciae]NKQ80349.1 hypothetical protein [Rhizobium ruizarguesonis]
MSDSLPLRPDAVWYDSMHQRYGAAVPDIEHLQIRRGLQSIVEDLFEKLADADRFRSCRMHGIATRNAGFVVIDARFSATATEADKRMCNRVLERIQERLSESCEHCGKPGEIVLKIGMEARLADPDIELGDRLLCAECYESWSGRDD